MSYFRDLFSTHRLFSVQIYRVLNDSTLSLFFSLEKKKSWFLTASGKHADFISAGRQFSQSPPRAGPEWPSVVAGSSLGSLACQQMFNVGSLETKQPAAADTESGGFYGEPHKDHVLM